MTTEEKNIEIAEMKRVWSVYCDPLFQKYLDAVSEYEKDRKYCRHGWDHLISTARIAYILDLERNMRIPKDIIYTMAILHDLGRAKEYAEGTPHDKAGAEIAEEILSSHEFSEEEVRLISDAISGHRAKTVNGRNDIPAKLLLEADKLSRECYRCRAADTCKWSEERKNNRILF